MTQSKSVNALLSPMETSSHPGNGVICLSSGHILVRFSSIGYLSMGNIKGLETRSTLSVALIGHVDR